MYAPEMPVSQAGSDHSIKIELAPEEGHMGMPAGPFDVLRSFDPAQTRLALFALDVFQQPFDPSAAYGIDPETGKNKFVAKAEGALSQAVAAEGLHAVAEAFRLFRTQQGETDYKGMYIEPSMSRFPTGIFEYLTLIHQRRLIINRWLGGHDERDHLAGGLLATHEVANHLSQAAGFALENELTHESRKDAGLEIDFAVSYVRGMWLDQPKAEEHSHDLAKKIESAYGFAGEEFPKTDALAVAARQLRAIRNWHYGARMISLALK